MDTLIVYLDDAEFARHQIMPMLAPGAPASARTQWVLVACAPRMSRHIGKWLTHSSRENWRQKWSEKVFSQITPALVQQGDTVRCVLAKGPLPELTAQLMHTWGAGRVVDARRPKFGQEMPPVTREQPQADQKWQLPSAVAGMGAVLVLAAD
jgi:hypothetical protein